MIAKDHNGDIGFLCKFDRISWPLIRCKLNRNVRAYTLLDATDWTNRVGWEATISTEKNQIRIRTDDGNRFQFLRVQRQRIVLVFEQDNGFICNPPRQIFVFRRVPRRARRRLCILADAGIGNHGLWVKLT